MMEKDGPSCLLSPPRSLLISAVALARKWASELEHLFTRLAHRAEATVLVRSLCADPIELLWKVILPLDQPTELVRELGVHRLKNLVFLAGGILVVDRYVGEA